MAFSVRDVIDILIVASFVYALLTLIKGTRATQMITGLFIVLFFAFLANVLNLTALKWIVSGLKDIWIVVFVILFQPEIRRALASLGKPHFLYLMREEMEMVAREVARACLMLSDKRVGALIVITRTVGLRTYMETGIRMDAKVDANLLVSIFSPYSPLHDGAVIIQGENIVAAKCILPVSDSSELPPTLGLRHRAAVGLTEETDAVVVVVSEETGAISIAMDGKLIKGEEIGDLEGYLSSILSGR
ncbi:TIGR00159 family protein [bacterium]|nr:MAG: TIGR00159 family protein [bacterium]RKZ21169.1 MAG: TIGR00159 family protein [bacterium]